MKIEKVPYLFNCQPLLIVSRTKWWKTHHKPRLTINKYGKFVILIIAESSAYTYQILKIIFQKLKKLGNVLSSS